MMRNTARPCVVAVLLVIGVRGFSAQERHDPVKYAELVKAEEKLLDEQLPLVDFNAPKPSEASKRERRLRKDRRHDLHDHPISEGMTVMSTVYHWPAYFPALPVEQSATVVIGKITEAEAHISSNKSGVYSEVVIAVEQIIKDKVGIKDTVVAEREGGRIRFPSGSIFRYFVDGMGIPKFGHRYLLFLKPLEDGDFSIITGYQLLECRVIPLDRSGVVDFDQYKGAEVTAFLDQVRELITNSKSPGQ